MTTKYIIYIPFKKAIFTDVLNSLTARIAKQHAEGKFKASAKRLLAGGK